MYQIGEVAKLARVTIRLLRHYDEIGLLAPTGRSESGYRLYSHADLQRLQQILFYRALEFPLADITRLMNEPGFDRHTALRQQRDLLAVRAGELNALLDLIDKTIDEIELPSEHSAMNSKEMFEVFPEMKEEWQQEAKQRWGDTDGWKQSAERWARYSKADWEQMKAEMAQVYIRLEQVYREHKDPASEEAIAAIEAARLLTERWFYDCPRELHVSGTGWVSADERYVKNIDRNCPGLAVFMHEAAKANLAKHAS